MDIQWKKTSVCMFLVLAGGSVELRTLNPPVVVQFEICEYMGENLH